MQTILLDAVYINQSGGKVLLEYFICELARAQQIENVSLLLDDRLDTSVIDYMDNLQITKIKGSEFQRLKFYHSSCKEFTTIFCFGNVPPPCKIVNKDVYILFHNALLLTCKTTNYGWLTRKKFWLKRKYIHYRNQKKYNWIVQTDSMANLLACNLGVNLNSIHILPFYESGKYQSINAQAVDNDQNFLYVADGNEQKNHLVLLKAWEYIFDNSKLPLVLHLTISSRYPELLNEVDRLIHKGVRIINHGYCDFDRMRSLYATSNFFIMPSLSESFGLPIIEAAEAGCEIIAADLPYVYDVIHPMAVFNPDDSIDIAKKIIMVYTKEGTNRSKLVIENKIKDLIRLVIKDV
ncbi:glycosyltransferase [Sphingobacterium faecium]|uniref:glycosyltransferase n=1 Tax=Sphingobacterium faecium TaxID=34087 RepID=UPI003209D849